MGYKYLGEEFDIHTGGIDHIPIHHENEIAQAEGFCGKIPAKFWMHVNFLKVNGGKMSKSLNNLYTLDDLKEKGYEPEVYRMFNFSSSYRTPINFTWEAMDANKKALAKLREGYQEHLNGNDNNQEIESLVNKYEEDFHKAINDDLNMPLAMSVVWEVVKAPYKSPIFAELLRKFDTVLGLNVDKVVPQEKQEIPEEIIALAEQRKIARENKDWTESDRLRDEIQAKGYSIKDTKEGYEIKGE